MWYRSNDFGVSLGKRFWMFWRTFIFFSFLLLSLLISGRTFAENDSNIISNISNVAENATSSIGEIISSVGNLFGGDSSNDCTAAAVPKIKPLWNKANNPLIFDPAFEMYFDKLPLKGEVSEKPWVCSYWPRKDCGMAFRYQTSESGYDYTPPTESEVRNMSLEELKKLSPFEKLDIYRGDFNYSMVSLARKDNDANAESWEGWCHGWAPAAYNFKEPQPIVVSSKDGTISIPLGSSDVKAWLIWAQSELATKGKTCFVGSRCDGFDEDAEGIFELIKKEWQLNRSATKDINPGAFHLILANEVGKKNKSFVGDFDIGKQVWNHPVIGFESKVSKKRKASVLDPSFYNGAVTIASINTNISYAIEIYPQWEAANGTNSYASKNRVLTYDLQLDKQGRVIGGDWVGASIDNHPDFVWTRGAPAFDSYNPNECSVPQDIENVYIKSTATIK